MTNTKPSFSWAGKVDADDGVATFVAGGLKCEFPMATFSEAYDLSALISRAYEHGYKDGIADVSSLVHTALNSAAHRY